MASKVIRFTLWALVIVLLLLLGCISCYLWRYLLEDPGEPYRLVDEIFEEPYEPPEPPPDPVVFEDEKAYFEAAGARFEMPFGFTPEYPDKYGPRPGPHFDYYLRSYERNAIIRVRRTTGGAGSRAPGGLAEYARLYVEMAAGPFVDEAKLGPFSPADLSEIGADGGVEVLYQLAPENRDTWGYSYEYVIFLEKKPDTVWTVSLALVYLDEIDAELIRKQIRDSIRLVEE